MNAVSPGGCSVPSMGALSHSTPCLDGCPGHVGALGTPPWGACPLVPALLSSHSPGSLPYWVTISWVLPPLRPCPPSPCTTGCLCPGSLPHRDPQAPSPPVDELPADAALEEAAAAIAGVNAVVLPAAGVPAHLAQQHGAQRLAGRRAQPCRSGANGGQGDSGHPNVPCPCHPSPLPASRLGRGVASLSAGPAQGHGWGHTPAPGMLRDEGMECCL